MAYDPNRLYAILQNTGLQNKDNSLYQLLRELIGATAGNVSSISNVINNPTLTPSDTIVNQYLLGGDSDGGGDSEVGPPGPQGIQGIQGPLGPMGAIIYPPDAEDGDMYPPQQGPQGNPGPTGAQGPAGNFMLVNEYYLDEFILPNPQSSGINLVNILADTIATSETQASGAAYADLATPGPSVTLTTGTTAIIWMSAICSRSGTGNTGWISVDISGATTLAASNTNGIGASEGVSTGGISLSRVLYLTGLTAGSNTFKLQYHNDGGATWTFLNRSIAVLAL